MRRREWAFLFDCDGVLLDSNGVKTEAFRQVALPYGAEVATAVVGHHVIHGGVSRYVKIERMFTEVLGRAPQLGEVDEALDRFGDVARKGLLDSAPDAGAVAFLSRLQRANVRSVVVSGGDQSEVRWALERHGLSRWIDAIHGSPRTKSSIVEDLVRTWIEPRRAVLIGDSRVDMEVALEFGIEPIFVHHWTEFAGWEKFVKQNGVLAVSDLSELDRISTESQWNAYPTAADWVRSLR